MGFYTRDDQPLSCFLDIFPPCALPSFLGLDHLTILNKIQLNLGSECSVDLVPSPLLVIYNWAGNPMTITQIISSMLY